MNLQKQAFELLRAFNTLRPEEQVERILRIESLLKTAKEKEIESLLALRDIDQIRKAHAYLLILAGRGDEGVEAIKALVADYEKTIANLHEEAAFQLAEATRTMFIKEKNSEATVLANAMLEHSGKAKKISRMVLSALELLQQNQEKQ